MPDIKPGESKQEYVARCVPYVMDKEGATQKQAIGKCYGMYDYYTKNEDIVLRLSRLIGDETVTGDIATNTAGCFKKKKKKKNESTVIGGAYVGSAGNIAGSGQTRTVGDRRGEIEVLTRKPRPLKWSKLFGIFVPDTEKDVNESMQRYCSIYKAKNKKWYLELAPHEGGESYNADTYGPFDSEYDADEYIEYFSNPGGYTVDRSGKQPVPKKSPSGSRVINPRF